jgi:hypothetical protein
MSEVSRTNKVEALIAVDFGTTFSGLCWALKEIVSGYDYQ